MLEKRLYGLADVTAAEELGVFQLRRQPYLNLTGRGTIFAIADTGIDYTHPAFRYGDGRSRILAVWDQTAPYAGQPEVPFGRVYLQEELNEALGQENSLEIVPLTDESGHGTFMAGLAAGNDFSEENDFTGIAPDAQILAVKLREGAAELKEFWFVPREVPAFDEEDLIEAVNFMLQEAAGYRRPMVLYFGISSNQGDHNGGGRFSGYLDLISRQSGRAVVIAGGNEGNAFHHFRGQSFEGVLYQDAEIRVSGIKTGLFIDFWADAPDLYGIGFVSPTGETIEKLPVRTSYRETISFVFNPTIIQVVYDRVDPITGATHIRIFMENPVDGLWKIRVFQEEAFGGRFDLWLPISQFISGEAVFLRPDPETTVTEPGDSSAPMTIAAYSTETGGIYLDSSRGFTRDGKIKPDLAAPGVNIRGPIRGGLYTARSGTSVAAALAAGVALLLLESDQQFTGVQVKNYLIRGAKRENKNSHPNTQFGWGKINVYDTFLSMREVNN